MRQIIFVFILLIVLIPGKSNAQFWKKKKYHTNATSSKVTKPDGNPYRDAFIRKSNKGPNIKTKSRPIIKSKKKMHKFSTSRKTKKPGRSNFFKPKYSGVKLKKKSGDTFSRNANRTKKRAQKGGGKSGGVFKGRKK